MQLPPELCAPRAPSLLDWGLPEEEKPLARALQSNIRDMSDSCSELSHALALFDVSSIELARAHQQEATVSIRDHVWIPWQFMAARYGGLAIRNWGQALWAVQSLVGKIPTWLPEIDAFELREVRKQFEVRFPNIDKLRHSIAHPEFYSNANKDMSVEGEINAPVLSIKGGRTVLSNNIMGRTYVASFEKTIVRYDLSQETALALVDLTRRAFGCFARISN